MGKGGKKEIGDPTPSPEQFLGNQSHERCVFILAPEMHWIITWQWEICLCMQHSVKLPVNELVFNGAVRGGTRTWVQAWGPLPDDVSSSVARFRQQGFVKAHVQTLGNQGSCANTGRETCHWRSQLSRQMVLTFTVNVFWDPWNWGGPLHLAFRRELTATHPFCWLSRLLCGLEWELIYYQDVLLCLMTWETLRVVSWDG